MTSMIVNEREVGVALTNELENKDDRKTSTFKHKKLKLNYLTFNIFLAFCTMKLSRSNI